MTELRPKLYQFMFFCGSIFKGTNQTALAQFIINTIVTELFSGDLQCETAFKDSRNLL